MNALEPAHPAVRSLESHAVTARRVAAPSGYELAGPVRQAILCARQLLWSEQRADGTWQSVVRGDASAACHALILEACLRSDPNQVMRLAEAIEEAQRPQGGWSRYPGGPLDVSVSVQAYLALRLAGYDAGERTLARARPMIVAAGGADRCDAATRCLLALAGQISYDHSPPLSPELLLLPSWLLARVSADWPAWMCRNLPALAIAWSHRATYDAHGCSIRELFVDFPENWPAADGTDAGPWQRMVNRWAGRLERRGWLPLRDRALARAEEQLRQELQRPGHGALELVWQAVAFDALGFSRTSDEVVHCWQRLEEHIWFDDRAGDAVCQPYVAPCEDTADAVTALVTSGVSSSEDDLYAAGEVLQCLVTRDGHNDSTPPQVAAALRALAALRHGQQVNQGLPPRLSIHHADDAAPAGESPREDAWAEKLDVTAREWIHYLSRCQLRDGGWSACEPGALRPTSSAAATGAVIAALAAWRAEEVDGIIGRGVQYLRLTQRADGSWGAPESAGSLHSTAWALRGLAAAGLAADDHQIEAGARWLILQQHVSGGWLESPAAGHDRELPQSPVQTAWALQALLAAGQIDAPAVKRAVHFLLETQEAFGGWTEHHFVMCDRLDRWSVREMSGITEPLQGLSEWSVAFAEQGGDPPVKLRLVRAN